MDRRGALPSKRPSDWSASQAVRQRGRGGGFRTTGQYKKVIALEIKKKQTYQSLHNREWLRSRYPLGNYKTYHKRKKEIQKITLHANKNIKLYSFQFYKIFAHFIQTFANTYNLSVKQFETQMRPHIL